MSVFVEIIILLIIFIIGFGLIFLAKPNPITCNHLMDKKRYKMKCMKCGIEEWL